MSSQYALEVTTEHTVPFKLIFESLNNALDEGIMEFINDKIKHKNSVSSITSATGLESDNSGLRMIAVDPSNTVLISLKLDAKNFAKFECNQYKISLGININSFHKAIRTMDKDDNLTITYGGNSENFMGIKIDNPEKNKKRNIEFDLLDLKANKNNIPNKYFDVRITINSNEFHKTCREMNTFATHTEIKCYGNKVCMTYIGDGIREKIEYATGGSGINIKWDDKSENSGKPKIVQGIYELKNLTLFGKCQNLCSDIEILMKNNFPLVIKYTVATLGKINIFVAPTNIAGNNLNG